MAWKKYEGDTRRYTVIRFYKGKDYKSASKIAADIIAAQMILKPDCVLGLATGSTPIGAYQELIRMNQAGLIDFSEVTTCNLDEYVGLGGDDEQSYRYFMNHQLFDHVNIDKARTHVPNGLADDIQTACREYDEIVASVGGADLQLLGIGHDGHIGFNEPGDSFDKGTHLVDLQESTIRANSRFWGGDESKVPRQAVTMGIATVMSARRILIMACGADKREIITKAFRGPITPLVPASALQLHPCVYVVGDEAAMADLC